MVLDDKKVLYCSLCTSRPRKRPKHQDKIYRQRMLHCARNGHTGSRRRAGPVLASRSLPPTHRPLHANAQYIPCPTMEISLSQTRKVPRYLLSFPADRSDLTPLPLDRPTDHSIPFPPIVPHPRLLNPLRANHLVFVLCYCVSLLDHPGV